MQGKIVFYRIQLLLQGDNLLTVVDNACPQQLRQILHRGADGRLTGYHAANIDQLENIKDEVRLNLALQLMNLCVAQQQTALIDLLKQGVQPVGHVVEGMRDSGRFGVWCFIHAHGKITAADTADGVQHLPQRTQQQDETGGGQQQGQDQDGSTDEKIHTRTLAHTGEDFGVWNIDVHALTAFAE